MKHHLSMITAATLTLAGAVACSSQEATHSAHTAGESSPAAGDRAWLAQTHQTNLAEIQAGELAQKKSANPAVRSAGKMLVTDHIASDDQVTRVAKALKLTVPRSAAPADAEAAGRLSNETGAAFDRDFLATMGTGHQKAIALTQTEIGKGTDPQIKKLAQLTLPVLRKHLSMLRRAMTTS